MSQSHPSRFRILCLCVALLGSGNAWAQSYSVNVASSTSAIANWPGASVDAAATLKLIAGGARSNWTGYGNLLTRSSPGAPGTNYWVGAAKDHGMADPSTLTVYALGLSDPTDDWEVGIFQQVSAFAAHPFASATLPAGYAMTGGGCFVDWRASPTPTGNLLTASYPDSLNSWRCDSKDHQVAGPATLTAYVIGIRPKRAGIALPAVKITLATSPVTDHPEAIAAGEPGWQVTGGGARAVPNDPAGGLLLTGTLPTSTAGSATPTGWYASAKDQGVASPGTITAYAINLQFGIGGLRQAAPPAISLSQDPVRLQIVESAAPAMPYAATSDWLRRWAGEADYYFGSHLNTFTGIATNPYSFPLYMSATAQNVTVREGGQNYAQIGRADLPNRNLGQFAWEHDPKNIFWFSPAQGPMPIDHGHRYQTTFMDPGVNSGKPPQVSTYNFVYVANGACGLQGFNVVPANPDPNTEVKVTVSAGPSCKRLVVDSPDSSARLFESTVKGLGGTLQASVSYLVRNNHPTSSLIMRFHAAAWDALGRGTGDLTQIATKKQPAPPAAMACPANPDGLPVTQEYCVSCPSGIPGDPNKIYIVGDYCNSQAGSDDLATQYGNCSIAPGPCQ